METGRQEEKKFHETGILGGKKKELPPLRSIGLH